VDRCAGEVTKRRAGPHLPVYVPDAGKSFLDRGRVPELVAKRLRVLEYIGTKLRDERFTASFAPGEVAKLSQRVTKRANVPAASEDAVIPCSR